MTIYQWCSVLCRSGGDSGCSCSWVEGGRQTMASQPEFKTNKVITEQKLHALRKALQLYEDRPLKSLRRKGEVWSMFFVIFLSYRTPYF